MAKRTLQDIAHELCKKHPNSAKMNIARALAKKTGCTFSCARATVATVTGTHGKRLKKHQRIEHHTGVMPEMPKSRALTHTPFEVVGDLETLILPDLHIPFHNEMGLNASVKYGKDRKPDIVLFNGDFGDWYRGSRYTQDPTSRFPFLLDELADQKKTLRWFRKQFPKARFIFKKGNHDERWDHFVWSRTPELSEMPEMRLEHRLGFEELGIEMVGDKRPIKLGKLPVWHGHELPRGVASPVNPARGLFMRTGTSGLMSHCHQTSAHGESNWRKDEVFCWSTGCLCNLFPEYAPVNRWNLGFAYVTQEKSGSFQVENLRINSSGEVHQ